ncbi:MAG: site-2 protease family protein [Acidimicrobiales bacterium]
MNESIRLGRIGGVAVGINWSVLVIFALITTGLASGRFPALYPDLAPLAYLVAGLAAGVVFLASLLAHEIAHALVARRNGIDVDGIALWLFGGVARLTGEAPDPGADLRVAGVGPLVSAVLAAAFFLVGLALDTGGAPGIVVGVFGWLAVINLVLALFNLMPAAPLDGGRILRAYLWRRRGDRLSASVTAARAGRGFGWLLVALGTLQFVAGAGFGGLWLVLIGWFLANAAGAEEQHARVRTALGDVRVADVMSPDPAVAPPDITVDAFLDRYVFPSRYSTFPLVGPHGEPAGLVTLGRVKRVPPDERRSTTVGEVACPVEEMTVVAPDEPLAALVAKLSQCSEGRAVVVDHGRVVGIVSPADVVRQLEVADLRGAGVDLERV